MKELIILTLMFIISFISIILLLTGIHIFLLYTSSIIDGNSLLYTDIISKFPDILLQNLIISIFFAYLIMFIRFHKNPRHHILSFIIHFILGLFFLVSGSFFLNSLSQKSLPPVSENMDNEFNENKVGKIIKLDSLSIYFTEKKGNNIYDIIVTREGTSSPRLKYYSQGDTLNTEQGLLIKLNDNTQVNIEKQKKSNYIFRADYILNIFMDYFNVINDDLLYFIDTPLWSYLIFCFSLILVFISSRFFMRITKWTLLNISFNLLAVLGILFLYNTITQFIQKELPVNIDNQFIIKLVPCFLMIIIGMLMFLLEILILPGVPKTRENKFA